MPTAHVINRLVIFRTQRFVRGLGGLALVWGGWTFAFPLSAMADASYQCKFGPSPDVPSTLPFCSAASPITLGDKKLTLNGADPDIYRLPTLGSGFIDFTWQTFGVGASDDLWKVVVDFKPDLFAPPSGSGVFKYTLNALAPGYVFNTVGLDSDKQELSNQVGGTTTVVKTMLPDYINTPLESNNGDNAGSAFFQSDYTSIAVTDEYSVTAGTSGTIVLDRFVNSYTQRFTFIPPDTEVPGPLPLLGAGAAFGFSRRLRNRVLAARRG